MVQMDIDFKVCCSHTIAQHAEGQLNQVSGVFHWVSSSISIWLSEAAAILQAFNAGTKAGETFLYLFGENRRKCRASPSERGFRCENTFARKILLPSVSPRSLWQSVNKETKGEKCLIVLEKDVPQFFNIFCPDAQRYCRRVGGAGRCVCAAGGSVGTGWWGIILAPLTSLQSLSHIHPSPSLNALASL